MVRAGSHAHSSRWLCSAGVPLPTNLIAARRPWPTGAEASLVKPLAHLRVALAFKVTRAFKLAPLKGGEINPDTSDT